MKGQTWPQSLRDFPSLQEHNKPMTKSANELMCSRGESMGWFSSGTKDRILPGERVKEVCMEDGALGLAGQSRVPVIQLFLVFGGTYSDPRNASGICGKE